MISDVLKTIKYMIQEYRFEDWFYLLVVLIIIIIGIYGFCAMIGVVQNPTTMGLLDAR